MAAIHINLRLRCRQASAWALLAIAGNAVSCPSAAAATPADTVFRDGFIYTVDARDSVQQALAVRAGKIVYVGNEAGVRAFIGPNTQVRDLHGQMLMPGLVDGHMHPLEGGSLLLKCSLNYEFLTIAAMQAKIQACLDQTKDAEPDAWLEVVSWFQEGMRPGGTVASRALLDALNSKRPIMVLSSFGHTLLTNSRGLELAHIDKSTPDPLGGKVGHDAAGDPNGLLEDAAKQWVTALAPPSTAVNDIKAAEAALDALRRQGITTFLEVAATSANLEAFAAVERAGNLTARAHFAVLIKPTEGPEPDKAIARVTELAHRFDQGAIVAEPHLTVRNIKLFLDGVITAPACTGAMLEPYFAKHGAGEHVRWAPGANRGPDVYFPAPVLKTLLSAAAAAGFDPHMHADGDRAVREGLDGVEAMRQTFPGRTIRSAIAHDEIVDPKDFPRFGKLEAIPVLSFQWEKPAPDTIDGAQEYLGPKRFRFMEPAGFLAAAGARIAFGSDWPVDPLNEWFALKVAVTRTNAPGVAPQYDGRLSADKGLSRKLALRAITMNSAYELHQEAQTGSLEVGKLADLIVVDRNLLTIPAEQIANARALLTMVGGQVVYEAVADLRQK